MPFGKKLFMYFLLITQKTCNQILKLEYSILYILYKKIWENPFIPTHTPPCSHYIPYMHELSWVKDI